MVSRERGGRVAGDDSAIKSGKALEGFAILPAVGSAQKPKSARKAGKR
jgi:hypothetical protein